MADILIASLPVLVALSFVTQTIILTVVLYRAGKHVIHRVQGFRN